MKIIALAFASLLLAGPAFAQTNLPVLPVVQPNNPIQVVQATQNLGFQAGIVLLDIGTIKQIDAFNQPGPGGSPGTASVLQFNISGLLNSLK